MSLHEANQALNRELMEVPLPQGRLSHPKDVYPEALEGHPEICIDRTSPF